MKGLNTEQILEITATAVILYLVLTNGQAFAQIVGAVGGVYTNAVRTLQGR